MKSAVRIALLYALISGLYIVCSDQIAYWVTLGSSGALTGWQNAKGLCFVLVSAIIIFFLVYHYVRGRDRLELLAEQAGDSFRQLFERNPLPLFVYALGDLRLLAANQAAMEVYGYTRQELLDMTLPQLCPAEDLPKILAHVARVRPFPYVGHWTSISKSGEIVEVEIISHPMHFEGQECRLIAAVDISRQRMAEQALAETMAARAEAEEAKTHFLNSISHEMRTPLNAVTGFVDLLEREDDPVKRREFASLAQEGAQRLLTLLESLINAAVLRSRMGPKNTAEVELAPFLAGVTDAFLLKARRKGIDLRLELSETLPKRALFDAHRLEEALKILVGNAIKFSFGGTVELRAWQICDGEGVWLRLAVADEGIGIPASAQVQVFESFYQVDRDLTRRFGGAGLGLFVARQLCELMGASLEVESAEAVGSTFTVTLAGALDRTGLFVADEG